MLRSFVFHTGIVIDSEAMQKINVFSPIGKEVFFFVSSNSVAFFCTIGHDGNIPKPDANLDFKAQTNQTNATVAVDSFEQIENVLSTAKTSWGNHTKITHAFSASQTLLALAKSDISHESVKRLVKTGIKNK